MLEQNNETTTPGNLEPGDRALADLAALGDRFCMYRSEVRTRGDGTEVKTKIPYVPGTLDRAKSNDSTTWRSFAVADAAMETGQYDGTLIALGSVGRHFLVGIDIDSCLSEIDGVTEVAAWARPYLDLLKATYVEVSPSRTGCKAFFFVRGLAINEVRRAFGIKEGASSRSVQIEQTGKAHPPAVELHFDRRFYALTKFYGTKAPITSPRSSLLYYNKSPRCYPRESVLLRPKIVVLVVVAALVILMVGRAAGIPRVRGTPGAWPSATRTTMTIMQAFVAASACSCLLGMRRTAQTVINAGGLGNAPRRRSRRPPGGARSLY
jgi:hypothetical protein